MSTLDLPRTLALTDAEKAALRCVVDQVIPASAEFGVPGAGDR